MQQCREGGNVGNEKIITFSDVNWSKEFDFLSRENSFHIRKSWVALRAHARFENESKTPPAELRSKIEKPKRKMRSSALQMASMVTSDPVSAGQRPNVSLAINSESESGALAADDTRAEKAREMDAHSLLRPGKCTVIVSHQLRLMGERSNEIFIIQITGVHAQ